MSMFFSAFAGASFVMATHFQPEWFMACILFCGATAVARAHGE